MTASRLRVLAGYGAIVVGAALAGLTLYEIYIRYDQLERYDQRAKPVIIKNQELTRMSIDSLLGYEAVKHPQGLFKPNESFRTTIASDNAVVFHAEPRTNNLGFLSDKSYTIERDPARPEYRIVIVGDSMTGTTTMDHQWVDWVEDLLNASADVRSVLGGRAVRVYNLGWPGAGFRTFWTSFDEVGRRFDPDLVIVNFIESDLPRTGGTEGGAHFLDDEQARMVQHAASFARRFQGLDRDVVFTVMPTYWDLVPRSDWPLSRRLAEIVPGAEFVFMHERLPLADGDEAIYGWYNLPYDGHLSQYGGRLYAWAMARMIGERLAGRPVDVRPLPPPDGEDEPSRSAGGREADTLLFSADLPVLSTAAGLEATAASSRAVDEWRFIADGTSGAGRARVSVVPGGPTGADDATIGFLHFAQVAAATRGVPSLTYGTAKPVALLAEKGEARLNLVVRSDRPMTFNLFVYQSFGTGGSPDAEELLVHHTFATNRRWRDIGFAFMWFRPGERSFGLNSDGALRIQIYPVDAGATFEIDIAELTLHAIPPGRPDISPRTVYRLRQLVTDRFVAAKLWRLRPYFLDVLEGRPLGFHHLPVYEPYAVGFEPIVYGDGPNETAYLYLLCTAEPYELSNPYCYHSFLFFMN